MIKNEKDQLETSVLRDIGLTNAQIKIYLTLLEFGNSKAGKLIKKSELQSSVVYNALSNLIEHGLVSFVKKDNVKFYNATNPENLVLFIEDKRNKIKELVPKLIKKKEEAYKLEQDARVYIGWKGVYHAYNKILDILPKGEEYIAFGAGFQEQHNEETVNFFKEFRKKRSIMKYDIKLILNESARKQYENYGWYKEFGLPSRKFVPGFAPIGLTIFGNYVLQVAFGDEPIAVLMHSRLIADAHRRSFYAMWKIAKE